MFKNIFINYLHFNILKVSAVNGQNVCPHEFEDMSETQNMVLVSGLQLG